MLIKYNHNNTYENVIKKLITLFCEGKFHQILEKESELIRSYSDSGEILNIIGTTYLELKIYKKALNLFTKAIKKNPRAPEIYYNLGLTFHHQGNIDKAIDSYKKAIQLKKDYAEAYCNIGMTFIEKQ